MDGVFLLVEVFFADGHLEFGIMDGSSHFCQLCLLVINSGKLSYEIAMLQFSLLFRLG